MRTLLAILVVGQLAMAQGFPPATRIDSWLSQHNQKRLRIDWDVVPDQTPVKLPDGTTEPRRAPWPFLVYVVEVRESKENQKLQERVFSDTRLAIANQAIRFVKLRPNKAVDLEFLAAVRGIKDPTLIAVNRSFQVVGVVKTPKEFTDKKVLALLATLAKSDYDAPLATYVKDYVELLMKEEQLSRDEKRVETLQEKAAQAKPDKAKKLDAEADELEAQVASERARLEEQFQRLRASLVLRGEQAEELPTTIGKGKQRRKLTPQELEAIEAYRQFAKDDNAIVRAAAVEDLGNIDSAVMVTAILDAANDIDPRVVEAAGKALGRMKSDEALEAMTEGLADSNSKARRAALLGFANCSRQHPPACAPILERIQENDELMRQAAVRALANQKAAEGVPALIAALDDSVPAIRVIAAQALGELRATDAAAALVARIDDADWSLQKAAVEALGRVRAKESVEPLLKKFEDDEGLVIEVVYQALVAITGQDYKYRAELWRKWWDTHGKNFKLPTDEEIVAAKLKFAKSMEGYAKSKRKYAKIETLSRKMIFILDISTSMRDKIVIPPDATEAERAEYPDRVRMEIAKREMIEMLATLDDNVFFNIITFAGRVDSWRDGLVSGSSKNAAIKYVQKLKTVAPASGNSSGEEQKTNTYGALIAAFGLADSKVPDWKSRTKVDTIFLVTDGLPTTGEIVEIRKVVAAINEINRTRGIVIHVICFDKEALRRLKPLAEQSGGQAVLRGF